MGEISKISPKVLKTLLDDEVITESDFKILKKCKQTYSKYNGDIDDKIEFVLTEVSKEQKESKEEIVVEKEDGLKIVITDVPEDKESEPTPQSPIYAPNSWNSDNSQPDRDVHDEDDEIVEEPEPEPKPEPDLKENMNQNQWQTLLKKIQMILTLKDIFS